MPVSYNPRQIAQIINATVYGYTTDDQVINWLLTDSRKVSFPATAVFFALVTSKNDGHRYISQLIEQGVKCFVVSSTAGLQKWFSQAVFLKTDNTTVALQTLAAHHRHQFHYPVLGITGSNGKTIVKEWLAQILSSQLNIVRSPRSFNSQTGVPLSVWNMDSNHQLAIFEAGISTTGEMERLQKIIDPDMGIFTNIGPAHDEGFSDRESKAREKLRLFTGCRTLIFSGNNPTLAAIIRNWALNHTGVKLFSWGQGKDNDLVIETSGASGQGTGIRFTWENKAYALFVPFSDEASLENIMHCISFLLCNNYNITELQDQLLKLEPLAMRMEMKQAINNCILINDSYSSDTLSLAVALDFLAAKARTMDKVLIMSDILQSGMNPDDLYRGIAAMVKEKGVNRFIGIGKTISEKRDLFLPIGSDFFSDTEAFLREYDFTRFRNMGILLKGARAFGMERISNKLQLKDHQTVLEINMDALVNNLTVFRTLLSPGVKIMAMVKAFSYGSGSYEIASLLQFHGVDYLAVAFADEGTELRTSGITLPIVVLNPELHNPDVLFRHQLEPEIYSPALLERIGEESLRYYGSNARDVLKVHIKLDTGMHRLGFGRDELPVLFEIISRYPAIRIASVFSHLAASEDVAFDDFTSQQLKRFEEMTGMIRENCDYDFMKHMANSAAVCRFPMAHYDMVRLGIGLYGIDTGNALKGKLQQVATFKSVISQIKEIPKGESVGYSRAAMLTRNTRMAIVPVGYADGLNRKLGNGNINVMINGKLAPTLGNISMDMCSIDITEIDAREGDEVIIFGPGLPAERISRALGTIPYEVFTSIPPRVKRVYFGE